MNPGNSRPKFSRQAQTEFFKTLRQRVHSHFSESHRSTSGDWRLLIKALVMLALFAMPYGLLILGGFDHLGLFFLLWTLMGLGIAAIGVNVMHDANHGSFSRHRSVNNVVRLVMNMLGGDASIWRLQHNVLHHTFTNIHEADEDIIGPPLLRFSPHDTKRRVHRFQYLYAWFLYGLMTLIKVAYTDYKRALRYRKMGLIPTRKALASRLIKISTGKLMYFGYMLVIPMLLVPQSPWLVVAGFIVMHAVTGLILAVLFQTAHVMPTSDYPLPNEKGMMENSWAVHQLRTTTNFAPGSPLFSWLIGGLNYQVEHHLFANISHVHYRDLSRIVSQTAWEFGIPYHCQPSFAHAILNHGKMLHRLGR